MLKEAATKAVTSQSSQPLHRSFEAVYSFLILCETSLFWTPISQFRTYIVNELRAIHKIRPPIFTNARYI
jgi:hypothetical protein